MKRSTPADYGSDKGSLGFSGKLKPVKSFSNRHQQQKQKDHHDDGNDDLSLSSSYTQEDLYHRKYDAGELLFSISRELKSSAPARVKVSEVSSLLGKARTAGFGKAVEVLDTLGSSMTNLRISSFLPRVPTKRSKISILSFEVANTIVKGASLMQALSKDNIKHLKEAVLPSKGVQRLISEDMDELLRFSASDKREELKIFSGEVARFGNRCKDPQWHNLDRYFERFGSELIPHMQLEEAETNMEHLKYLVQNTAEVYHESHVLDTVEQDFRRKQREEENPNASPRGDH